MADETKKEILTIHVDENNIVTVQTFTIAEFSTKMVLKHWGESIVLSDIPENPDPMFWPVPCVVVMKFKRVAVEVGIASAESVEGPKS